MKRKMKLGSIEEEAALCRKAFKGVKVGTLVLHCHHEVLCEPLTEEAENRIAFILSSKAKHEQALRLHLFRPVSDAKLRSLGKKYPMVKKVDAEWQKADAELRKAYAEWRKADAERQKADAEWQKAYAEWQKADAEWQKADAGLAILVHPHVCKNCPWDGKTIFPQAKP